jgi:hypothetical protein
MGQWAKKTLTLKIDNKFLIGRTGDLYGNGSKGGIFATHLGKKYPMSRCMSYVPFRTRKRVNNVWVDTNYGKSRLDFFLISSELFAEVDSVFYGERIARDLDHLEVVLKLGKQPNVKKSILIRNCTLDRDEVDEISVLGYLDCLNTHLIHRNDNLQNTLGILHGLYIDLCNLRGEIEINGEMILLRKG